MNICRDLSFSLPSIKEYKKQLWHLSYKDDSCKLPCLTGTPPADVHNSSVMTMTKKKQGKSQTDEARLLSLKDRLLNLSNVLGPQYPTAFGLRCSYLIFNEDWLHREELILFLRGGDGGYSVY